MAVWVSARHSPHLFSGCSISHKYIQDRMGMRVKELQETEMRAVAQQDLFDQCTLAGKEVHQKIDHRFDCEVGDAIAPNQ